MARPDQLPGLHARRAVGRGAQRPLALDRRGPGAPVEFDTEVVEDIPGERLAWKSVGGQVATEGAVRFDPRDEETDLEYSMHYEPPGGKAGEIVAKLFADPEDSVQRSLDAFKALVEHDARPRTDARTEVDSGEAAPPSHGG